MTQIEAKKEQVHDVITQDSTRYSREDHEVWSLLYEKRMSHLRDVGSRAYLSGAEAIGLSPTEVPDLRAVNEKLSRRTGWAAVPVRGFIPASRFFAFLAMRRFPTTISVRPKAQLDYLPEPDIFHDVFGHVPLHADPVFADFLQRFGAVASAAKSPEAVERMARLFWFTVEFGLIEEDGELRAYGSGLISSQADCINALGPSCERRPFSLGAVMDQSFEIDHVQPVLFVIRRFEELFEAVSGAETNLHSLESSGSRKPIAKNRDKTYYENEV